MMKRILIAAALASLAFAGISTAQTRLGNPTAPKPKPISKTQAIRETPPPIPGPPRGDTQLTWLGGSTIMTCQKAGTCIARTLPTATGKPIRVVQGPFLNQTIAPISMIVVSNKRYSLCYLTSKNTDAALICHPVKTPIIKGGRVKTLTYPGIGTVLDIAVDPTYAKSSKGVAAQIRSASAAFGKAFSAAQISATKVATKRYSGKLIPRPFLSLNGTSSTCYQADDGKSYCMGGVTVLPSRSISIGEGVEDGGGDWGDGGEYPSGADDGGGYPDDSGSGGGEGSGEGNGEGGGQVVVPPGFPIPPGATTSPGGTTVNCMPAGDGTTCTVSAPRPEQDPNTTDPDTGAQIPPSTSDNGWSWCDLPVINYFFCTPVPPSQPTPTPVPPPAAPPQMPTAGDLPPFTWPEPPNDGQPIQKYRDGYEEEVQYCDGVRAKDETKCGLNYVIMGGPVYKRKLDAGESLTASERKMLNAANREYSACMSIAANDWSNCYFNAQDKYRE